MLGASEQISMSTASMFQLRNSHHFAKIYLYLFFVFQEGFSVWRHAKLEKNTVFRTCRKQASHAEIKSLVDITPMQKPRVKCSTFV